MILFDLLNDKNKFNYYADEIPCNREYINSVLKLLSVFKANKDAIGSEELSFKDPFLNEINIDLLSLKPFLNKLDNQIVDNVTSMYYYQGLNFFLTLKLWENYQKIYSVDNEFYQDFVKTESIKLDYKLLSRLPFPTFYIDLSNVKIKSTNHHHKIVGMLVNVVDNGCIRVNVIDSDNSDYNPLICYKGGTYNPQNAIKCSYEMLKKIAGPNDHCGVYGDECILVRENDYAQLPKRWEEFYNGNCRFLNFSLEKDNSPAVLEHRGLVESLGWSMCIDGVVEVNDYHSPIIEELTFFLIQFLYFLGSENKDISENKRTANKYRQKYKGTANKDIGVWDVGVRYGNKLRLIDKKQKLYGDIVGGYEKERPRPYVRCAHWHNYWCGSGTEKHLELRWLSPVFCNGTVDDIVATINSVTSEDIKGSDGEELIKQYLERFGVQYEREYTVTIKNHHRRFDFFVHFNNKDYFIEFDGEQHFFPVEAFGGETGFSERRRADWDKTKYARKNKIPLLRIRYDQKSDIPELIDVFFEKPSLREFNSVIPKEKYYM